MLTTVQLPFGLQGLLLAAPSRAQPLLHPILLVAIKICRGTGPPPAPAAPPVAPTAAPPQGAAPWKLVQRCIQPAVQMGHTPCHNWRRWESVREKERGYAPHDAAIQLLVQGDV